MRKIYFIGFIITIGIAGIYFLNRNKMAPPAEIAFNSEVGTLVDIKTSDYNRYILTKNTFKYYLLHKIKEFGEFTSTDNYSEQSIYLSNSGEWWIIKFAETADFYAYHNLLRWLLEYKTIDDFPFFSIGFAKHKTDSEQDYIFYLDSSVPVADTAIGAFKNGNAFYIDLPDAGGMNGFVIVTKELKISFDDYIRETVINEGLDIIDIDSLNYTEHKIKMGEYIKGI